MNQIFNWKKLVFFPVKLIEIFHASSYDMLVYIYKVKKPARLVRGRQPPRRDVDQMGSEAYSYKFRALEGRKKALAMLSYVLNQSALSSLSNQGYQNAY